MFVLPSTVAKLPVAWFLLPPTISPKPFQPLFEPTTRSCEPACEKFETFSAYPITRFPRPFTAPVVEPDPDTICTLTAANCTVGLPPTPDGTNVGASTAVVLGSHEGAEPVPPDTPA